MGDVAVDVTVRTRFADPQTLMSAVGSWIERGCLRVPALIECGRPFEIELLTSGGTTAVRGSAEGVRHDGNCTYVRFLSASRDQTDGGVWFDLADATVDVPVALAAQGRRARSASGEIKPRSAGGDWSVALGTPIPQPVPAGLRDLKGGAARGTPKQGTAKTEMMPAPAPKVPAVPKLPKLPTQQRPITQNVVDRSRLPAEPPGAKPQPPGIASGMTIELIADLPGDVPTQPAAPLMALAAVPMEIAATSPPAPVVMTMELDADEPTESGEPVMLTQRAQPAQTAPAMPVRPHSPSAPPPVLGFVHVPVEAPVPVDARGGRPTTIPPPLVALWSPDARLRPPTIPPGWAAEPTAQGMWIPVVDPAALPGVGQPMQAPAAPAAASKPSRGPMLAAVAIAVAGAVVAIAAVLWARGVKPTAQAPAGRIVGTNAAATCPVAAPTAAPTAATPPTPTPTTAAAAPVTTTTTKVTPAPTPTPTTTPTTTPTSAMVATEGGPCSLAISTSAQNVKVFIGGRNQGVAPVTVALPCEPVAVTFKHPRYNEEVRRVTPTADTATLHVTMERPRGLLKVVSKPAGASVAIDGKDIGKTPLVQKISAFKSITLTVKAPGMKTQRRLVYPKRGTTVIATTLHKGKR